MEIDKILNQDTLDGMKEIGGGKIDLIVTDPPYLISYKTSYRKDKEHKFTKEILNDDNFELVSEYLKECYRILKDNAAAYVFCSAKTVDFFIKESKAAGFDIKNLIVWDKGNWTAGDLEAQFGQQYEIILLLNKGRATINGKRYSDIWRCPRVSPDKAVHQNQKPLSLIKMCIEAHSKEGDLIFDGFMGSGTTAVAAINLNRHYIGFELDKEYFEVAQKRIKSAVYEPSLFNL